jgi:membrane protease YdiL (CAAX protease family)
VSDQPAALVPPAPPPDPSQLLEASEPQPQWPAWYALLAFLTGVIGGVIVAGTVAAIAGVGSSDDSPGVVIAGTLILDGALVGSALLFASFVSKPRGWQFGLRSTRLFPALGWASLGLVSFYVFSAVYSVVVQPDVKQKVTESLGADRGTLGLIVAGVMVIAVAPAAEEFFFRGFFYRALRTRFPVLAAAVIDGAFFGLIHFDFSGAHGLLLVPPLAVLGFIFCLVYERTGSIFPTIALHAFNNSLAYAVQADGAAVSAVLGPAVIAACVLLPRLAQSPPRPAPALR